MCVAGCTGSGKSQWVDRLLSHIDLLVSEGPITGVLYCYGEVNDNVLRLQRMESATNDNNMEGKHSLRMCHGAPEEGDVEREARATGGRLLLVLDDLMSGGLRCGFLDTVFTRGSHNWGVSVVLITQHLFTRELRIARNNCHYMVLMRNPAGALQIRNLGAQLFPGGALRYFLEAYEDATAEPFGYLLVDMHPTTEQQLRLKTHIYPGEMCVQTAVDTEKISKGRSQQDIEEEDRRLWRGKTTEQQPQARPFSPPVLSEHVRRHIDFFQQLKAARGSPPRCQALVAGASSEQLLCLVESALNILRARVPIQRRHLDRLRQRASDVRTLSRVRSTRSARRLLLNAHAPSTAQTGRGIPPLVGLLASVLVPVLVQRVFDTNS
ncbi:hypothetical protein niasHT_013083 [Heterodera trifolii]|uniref:Uncharacterized protein n=1 Tax=Heterodera trifolii TaxID=157864 RepID=A0ABD2L7A8_9BILA